MTIRDIYIYIYIAPIYIHGNEKERNVYDTTNVEEQNVKLNLSNNDTE